MPSTGINDLTVILPNPSLSSQSILWPSQLQIQFRRSHRKPPKCSRRRRPCASRFRQNPRPHLQSSCRHCRPQARLRLLRHPSPPRPALQDPPPLVQLRRRKFLVPRPLRQPRHRLRRLRVPALLWRVRRPRPRPRPLWLQRRKLLQLRVRLERSTQCWL